MKIQPLLLTIFLINLTACSLTPEQKAEREAKRIRAEQALQVELAKQCDVPTAELMAQQFNPPVSQTAQEKALFEKNYVEKVNNPMFQACYKLAWQNYKNQEELRRMEYERSRDYGFWGHSCYFCW